MLENVAQQGKALVIIGGEIDGEALRSLIDRKDRGVLKSVVVEAPESGDRRRAVLEDIAILTGGQVISEEADLEMLENTDKAVSVLLGRARRVVVTKDETVIVDGGGDVYKITGRVDQIRAEIGNAGSDDDRKNLQWRLATLAGGIAVITVGAATETGSQQRKERVEAAIMTARMAIEGGMLPGGGAALVDVQRRVQGRIERSPGRRNRGATGAAPPTSDEATGTAIVLDSLAEPLKQIVANAGHDDPAALADSIRSLKPGTGFDVITDRPRDMLAAGIIDPCLVTSHALASAAGLAQRLLLLG